MRKVFFLLLIVTGSHGQQFPFEFWHDGKIVMESGDTLKGKVKYNLENDLLQIQLENLVETLTARKVIFFEIFDVVATRYRQFYSLPYATSGQYKAPIFFELLEEGKMTLLVREAVEYKTYSSFYFYGSYTKQVLVYKYFLLDESGEIIQFAGNKNDWLYLMGNKADEVQRYAKTNRLDFEDKYELMKIVAYYNSLFKKK